ncbi:4-alpha-glucanotransferase [Aerococcus sanguinicola]|uniref:4-alpha-glucanotransferase n=1 Tax=Aerococcus sanguinicola TaxID=119206 RepID=UPI0018A7AF7F|nr:4-alpha-glucanotransferase [Aerococcus sanguinicola]
MERTSGVLLHITSLASPYGIGSFGRAAYEFVDFLSACKQSYWQILPLTTTSYGDSPYQSFSAFAGNTHLIDFDRLVEAGYLKASDLEDLSFAENPEVVDYGRIFRVRRPLLEKAVATFQKDKKDKSRDFKDFVQSNQDWLEAFCQYMTVKESFDLKAWYDWPEAYRTYQIDQVKTLCWDHADCYNYHLITQYFFFKQWEALKAYANQKHIQIIGDMPIYVARDSVEMWTQPAMFKTDANKDPLTVAGTPPDNFSDTGQYWGNPIYDWDYMADQGYQWWIQRMAKSFEMYDIVRIDHFRGFESFWEVPYGSETAASGHWTKGPGLKLFKALKDALGDLAIIAEDLGFMTDEVIEMREATGYPGMKILQFAFNGKTDSLDLPHHYSANTIAYVGTHDNETARGWYEESANQSQRDQVDAYLNRRKGEAASHALNRGIAASSSQIAIYTMQDLLNLGNRARMNTPSTIGCNWQWRMAEDALTADVYEQLTDLTETYFRANPKFKLGTSITNKGD